MRSNRKDCEVEYEDKDDEQDESEPPALAERRLLLIRVLAAYAEATQQAAEQGSDETAAH